jgi:hypothetical protein
VSGEKLLAALTRISKALERKSTPEKPIYGLSAWWAEQYSKFYLHPSAHLAVWMVGRSGDKTRSSVISGIAEVTAYEGKVPGGEVHYYCHISENTSESEKTLGIYESYLRLLGIPFDKAGDTIKLRDKPLGIRTIACRVPAVSGFRAIGFCCDEVAKWNDSGSDPTEGVLTSIKAMCASAPTWRGRLISSPTGVGSYFHDLWSQGDTPHQVAAQAASWIANPGGMTEARSHELEQDEKVRLREYGAIPQSGSSDAIDFEDVGAMIRPLDIGAVGLGETVILIDSSAGRHDGWSYCCCQFARDGQKKVLYLSRIGCFAGKFAESVSFDSVVSHIADVARRVQATRVFGDQFQEFPLTSGFARHGLRYSKRDWPPSGKIDTLSTLRSRLKDRAVVVEPGAEAELLRKELLSLKEVRTPGNSFTIAAKRTGAGHADRAQLVLLAVRVVSDGDMVGQWAEPTTLANSPYGAPSPNAPRAIPIRGSGGFQDWGAMQGQARPAAEPVPLNLPRTGNSPGGIPWGRAIVPRGWNVR